MRKYISTLKTIYFICIVTASLVLFISSVGRSYNKEIQSLSGVMAEKIVQAEKRTVAVADFTDLQGNVTELGRFIAERFSVALAGAGKGLAVIDRTHIKTLLREHKLSETGLIDTTTAKELGKIAGVEALITGTLTPFGDTVEMTIKVLDTETAKVIDAGVGSVAKTEAIKELLEKGISTGGASSQQKIPIPKFAPTKAQQTVETKGFNFALKECKRSGSSVTCYLLVTSIDQDQELYVSGSYRTRIFDDLGNEYKANYAQLGNKEDDDSVRNRLVAGIPTKASVKFEGLASQANFITLLEIYCSEFVVQYRNVPFSK
jgi:TolB-like protein